MNEHESVYQVVTYNLYGVRNAQPGIYSIKKSAQRQAQRLRRRGHDAFVNELQLRTNITYIAYIPQTWDRR